MANYDVINNKTKRNIYQGVSATEAVDFICNIFYGFDTDRVYVNKIGILDKIKTTGVYEDFTATEVGATTCELWSQDDITKTMALVIKSKSCRAAVTNFGKEEAIDRLEYYANICSQYGYSNEEDIATFIRCDIERRCAVALALKEANDSSYADPLEEIYYTPSVLGQYRESSKESAVEQVSREQVKSKTKGTSYNVVNKKTGWVLKRDVTELEGEAFIINAYFDFDKNCTHPSTKAAKEVIKKTGGFRDLLIKKMHVALPTHDLPNVSVLSKAAYFLRNDSDILSTLNLTRKSVRENPERAQVIEKPIALGFLSRKGVLEFLQCYTNDFGEFLYYCKQNNLPHGLQVPQAEVDRLIEAFLHNTDLMNTIRIYDVADVRTNNCVVENLRFTEAVDFILSKVFVSSEVPEAKACARELAADKKYKNYRIVESGTHAYTTHQAPIDIESMSPFLEEDLLKEVPEETAETDESPQEIAQPVANAPELDNYLNADEVMSLVRSSEYPEFGMRQGADYLIQVQLRTTKPELNTYQKVINYFSTADVGVSFLNGLPDDIQKVVKDPSNTEYWNNHDNLSTYVQRATDSMFDKNGLLHTYTKAYYKDTGLQPVTETTTLDTPTVQESNRSSSAEEPVVIDSDDPDCVAVAEAALAATAA